jgi:hypothetical protein
LMFRPQGSAYVVCLQQQGTRYCMLKIITIDIDK